MKAIKFPRLISCALMTTVFIIGGLLFDVPSAHSIIESNAGSYSLNLNSSNVPSIVAESFGSGEQTDRLVSFSYELADDNISAAHIKLASVGGKIYNTDIITDVGTIKAEFTGGTLYVGGANHLGKIEQSVRLISGTNCLSMPDYPYYVFYSGGTGDVVITSIRIDYSCTNPPIPPDMVLTEYDDYYEVSSYTGPYPNISIPAYHNGKLITKIADEAFTNNTSIQSVILPNTITSIGAYAFSGCTALENFFQSENLQTIGAYAFYDCQSLTNFEFPSSLTYIGDYAFSNCYSLLDVSLANGITALHQGTFYFCMSIRSFNIPSSVTTIETSALHGSSQLLELFIPITVTTIQTQGLSRIVNCNIYVQAASRPSGWSYTWIAEDNYANIFWNQS